MEPCKICGAVECSESFGGPGICPKCDCGVYNPHILAWHNNRLSTELADLKLRLAEAEGYLTSLLEDRELEIISFYSASCGSSHYICSICGEVAAEGKLIVHDESCIYPSIVNFLSRSEVKEILEEVEGG
jgi:hypothetical protein